MACDLTPTPTVPRPGARAFRLTRYFSLTSLIGIVAVTACLFWTYRELTERHLIEHESRANADLTRAFANATWSRYRSFVVDSAGRSRQALLGDPVLPQGQRPAAGAPRVNNGISVAYAVKQIKELLDTRVRPAVAQDGGDIVFHSFEEGVVYLHMQGSCSGCPSSTATLKHGIQTLLRHFVPDVTEVRPV